MRVSPNLTRSIPVGGTRAGLLVAALGLAALLPAALAQQGAKGAPSAPAESASASAEATEIQRLIRSGQSAQALKIIDAALAKNPKDPLMRFRRGVALSMLDRKAEAIPVFQGLIQDYPTMPAPYNNLAVLYGSQGDYEKARVTLEKALRANPETATAYENLGDVYAQLASQAYEKALQLKKPDASTPVKLGLLRELVSTPDGGAVVAGTAGARAAGTKTTQVAAAQAPAPAPVAPAPAPAPAPVPAPAPASATHSTTLAAATPAPPPAMHPAAPAPIPSAVSTAPAARPSAASPAPAAHPSAASPAPAPASTSNAIPEVESAIRAWAQAWSRRDVSAYVAAYTPDFAGSARNHRAWEDDRRARIEPRKRIAVELSEMRVSVTGDTAEAHFKQTYQSDTLNNTVHKTLALVRTPGGKWLIRRENVGG